MDASKHGCGTVVSQNDLPISFASIGFDAAAQKNSTIEKELIAIHFAVMHFRPYLYGSVSSIETNRC